MTDCEKLLHEAFEKYDKELSEVLSSGNTEPYCYNEVYTRECGASDSNCTNRLRLAYAILYTEKHRENSRIDGLIVRLFNEEVLDRECSSFQGIGSCLEVLTELLNVYEIPDRELLFERARNANFDCLCDYRNDYSLPPLKAYTEKQAIELFISLKEKAYAEKLLKSFAYSDEICDRDKMSFCMKRFKRIGGTEDELYCARALLNMDILAGDDAAVCEDMLELMRIYNADSQHDKAAEVLTMLIPRLHLFDEWYSTAIGKNILEQCMDIILGGIDSAEEIWEWAEPILKKISENMYRGLYRKAGAAAYSMGNFELADFLIRNNNILCGDFD